MKQRALRRSVGLAILLVWAGGIVRAQNPPFSSPALDANCYFPTIGDPNEIDTIYGSSADQYLGSIIKNLGPKLNGGYGNVLIGDLSPSVAQVATGPSFNLHQMKQDVQKLDPSNAGITQVFHLGHFRDRSHIDIFANYNWRIYWADDFGNYDSNAFTQLKTNVYGNAGIIRGESEPFQPYVTKLTNDTLDDIVVSYFSDYSGNQQDTIILALFSNSIRSSSKPIVYEDTSKALYPSWVRSEASHSCTQGDFRGLGRDDLLAGSYYFDLFYYKNDPPFSLEKLANALTYDTLWTRRENTHWRDSDSFTRTRLGWPYESLVMPSLPKSSGDKSVDYLLSIPSTDDSDNGIFIFRGGTDFGSHRITIDSAAFVIRHPKNLDATRFGQGYDWPQGLVDAGDMTGTGNHVLYVAARNDYGDYWWDNFYVTGKALDEKIDMYTSAPYSVHLGDTLTANSDSLEDFLNGRSWLNGPDGIHGAGALLLYYGSKNIPVHLNPRWADVRSAASIACGSLTLSPNPAGARTVADILWPDDGLVHLSIYDVMGRSMRTEEYRLQAGETQLSIPLSEFPAGVYFVGLEGSSCSATARVVKIGDHTIGPANSYFESLRNAIHGGVPAMPQASPLPK